MIFLCFSSGDRYSVLKSCLYHLKNYGYETWYDYHELILGDKKREKNFEKAIQTCDFFIIIYSKNFLNSPCAVNEEALIFAEAARRNITIFPLLYNIRFSELPYDIQNKIENLIYNEINDSTGCIQSVNQMVVKILLQQMGYNEFDLTPSINYPFIQKLQLEDEFLKCILLEYLNLSKDNFNARISFLYCIYKYIETNNLAENIPIYYSQTITYLSHYTKLNIPYNHKEIIIAELVIINLLKLI